MSSTVQISKLADDVSIHIESDHNTDDLSVLENSISNSIAL